jgi:hypothetical protein
MPVKLGSALYKFLKDQGVSPVLPVKPPKEGGPRTKSPANWVHSVHGEFLNVTATDLISMFPQLKLDITNLCRVRNGKQGSHKGWMLKKDLAIAPQSNKVTNIGEYSGDLMRRGA